MILDAVNEAYVGKTKRLKELETCVADLRTEYSKRKYNNGNNGLYTAMGFQTINKAYQHPSFIKMKKLLEDEFGFYSVTLNLENNNGQVSTYPLHITPAYWFKMNSAIKNATKNNKAIKFDKSAELCTIIYITPNFLFSNTLTPAEFVAILLHEVGHNFEYSILSSIQGPTMLMTTARLINTVRSGNFELIIKTFPIVSETIKKNFAKFYNKFMENSAFSVIVPIFWFIKEYEAIAVTFLQSMLGNLNRGLPVQIMNLPNLVWAQESYKSEKFADAFVSLMGYGPEFAMAIKKDTYITDSLGVQRFIGDVPILGHLLGLNDFVFEHIVSLFEGHPDTSTRALTGVKLLEEDLKQTKFDPKTRAIIENDIKMMKKANSDWAAAAKDIKVNAYDTYEMHTRQALNNLVRFVCPEGDIRSKILNMIGVGKSEIISKVNNLQKPNFM